MDIQWPMSFLIKKRVSGGSANTLFTNCLCDHNQKLVQKKAFIFMTCATHLFQPRFFSQEWWNCNNELQVLPLQHNFHMFPTRFF